MKSKNLDGLRVSVRRHKEGDLALLIGVGTLDRERGAKLDPPVQGGLAKKY